MSNSNKFTNRLITETSPYLLQHAHNPVDWFPWGNEAFEKAKLEDKPIFLSIGYSACHWCHVMERESFEYEEIAKVMNELFVNIKVDREERLDLDGIYMAAVQMMTGHGGWPMSVFLDHDGRPFYGGTYFPPVDKYNVPAFPRLLLGISNMWKTKRDELLKSAAGLTQEIAKAEGYVRLNESINDIFFDEAFKALFQRFDSKNGGFGQAPKFPGSMSLQFALRYAHQFKNSDAGHLVRFSLNKMADGGIYDHIGGGFARYSVDAEWHVPHFEKMLYDNALLARLYAEGGIYFKDDKFKNVAIETLDFVLTEMQSKDGGYFSTLDADSEGVEGKFYVWTMDEFRAVFSEPELGFIAEYFDVSEKGNWEHTNVLRRVVPLELSAQKHQISPDEANRIISTAKSKLSDIRNKRIYPGRDEKILTGWNGLMISAMAFSGFHFHQKRFIESAEKAAEFIWNRLFRDQILYRVFKDEQTKIPGFIEDYGHYCLGLLDLAQFSGNQKYLHWAKQIADLAIAEFYDENNFGFYVYGKNNESLIVRQKDFYDNAVPSGNSSIVWALNILYRITGNSKYDAIVKSFHQSMIPYLKSYPTAFGWASCALFEDYFPGKEYVIVGDKPELWLEKIRGEWLPGSLILFGDQDNSFDITKGKTMINNLTTLYECENGFCNQPVTESETFKIRK